MRALSLHHIAARTSICARNKPFWHKVCSNVVLFSRTTSCIPSFSLPDKTLRDARKGWSQFETPSGCHTVVRGRRPLSKVWPKQQRSWWWQRSQWPNVAAAQHQTTKPKIPRRWDRVEAASPVHQPRQKFTQPQSTVCVVSRQPSKLLGLVPKRRQDWKKLLSGPTRGEFGSSWGAFGFHSTVCRTLPEECRPQQWPSWRQGNGIWRISERRLQHWRRNPESANCRQQRIGSGQFSDSTHLTVEREQEDHRKRARSLSVPSRNLSVLSPNVSLQVWRVLHDKSVGLDAIARGDSLARSSNRFNPLQ